MEKQRVKYTVMAKRMGRTWSSIRNRILILRKKRGIQPLPRLHQNGELEERVRTLCIPGVPDSDVANILGITRSAIRKVRKRLGIPPGCTQHIRQRKPERANISRTAKIIRLYASNKGIGMIDAEIARILNSSRQSVGKTRRTLGLPTIDRCEKMYPVREIVQPRIYTIRGEM